MRDGFFGQFRDLFGQATAVRIAEDDEGGTKIQPTLPGTVAIQFSPNNKIDFGGEFTFGDFGPLLEDENDTSLFDQRSLLLFGRARF